MNKPLIAIFAILNLLLISTKVISNDLQLDVISYHLTIEPIIEKGFISGTVEINFQINTAADSVVFSSGNLEIDKVIGDKVVGFKKSNNELIIYLSKRESTKNEIVIDYHGYPKTGLIFDSENNQAYTIYSTSQWMISNDSPADKALFNLDILIPNGKTCIASGELQGKFQNNGKSYYSYQQNYESPTYTYGFAIGDYNKVDKQFGDVLLAYYSQSYSTDQLKNIFKETPAMISFFEEKSGVNYYQSTYSQLLAGNYYQEMSGYSILKDAYGKLVLQDSTETNLISHELAHQWWGNRVTCKSWNHFWLNEGMATYMSAAYNEHRFGKQVYLSNIESYFEVYDAIKKRGNNKSLVFEDWSNPSNDDRNLVYFKGAYVLYLLREKLGDEKFWAAIRFYSTTYFGKSVDTVDFQKSIEESSGVNLDDFFNEWVY